MKKDFLYIINWKMNFDFDNEIKWIEENISQLQNLFQDNKKLILCPSYLSLSYIKTKISGLISLSAQNCSSEESGAYTGEISAKSLAEIGCSYCIVGHSERRRFFYESNDIIARKAVKLMQNNIVPIFCLGETLLEYEQKKTREILQTQLVDLINIIHAENLHKKEIILAYEPVWAIGTGIVPDNSYIIQVCEFIKEIIEQNKIKILYKIMYGGSVSGKNAEELKKIPNVDGFLIGKAGTDFQELKKIVLS